jgi:hypothetical protein
MIQKASQGPSHETNFFFNVLRNIFSISEFACLPQAGNADFGIQFRIPQSAIRN